MRVEHRPRLTVGLIGEKSGVHRVELICGEVAVLIVSEPVGELLGVGSLDDRIVLLPVRGGGAFVLYGEVRFTMLVLPRVEVREGRRRTKCQSEQAGHVLVESATPNTPRLARDPDGAADTYMYTEYHSISNFQCTE